MTCLSKHFVNNLCPKKILNILFAKSQLLSLYNEKLHVVLSYLFVVFNELDKLVHLTESFINKYHRHKPHKTINITLSIAVIISQS